MVDTGSDGLLAKLRLLSKRELQVLDLRCQGMKYADIGKALNIAVPTVKTDMGRVYMKLGLDVIEPSQRLKTLYDTVSPLLQLIKSEMGKARAGSVEKTPAPEVVDGEVVPEKEEPVPPKVKDMVEEDDKAIVPWTPAPLVAPPPRPGPDPRRRWWLVILVGGVVLGICLGAGAIYLLLRSPGGPLGAVPQPTPTLAAPTPIPANTTIPSPMAEVPTQTPLVVVVTATLPPASEAPTAVPAPAVSLPFADNFDNGADPQWSILSGTWITANGAFTTIQQGTQNSWFWTVLDGSSWQNYRVTVDVHIPYAYAASEGAVAILVRRTDNQTKYLGFYIDTLLKGSWALIGNRWSDEQSIAGTGQSLPDTATFQLEANGNSFTARVNGQTYQQITISGYQQGGVGLGILCEADKCPNFDNFKVEPLGP